MPLHFKVFLCSLCSRTWGIDGWNGEHKYFNLFQYQYQTTISDVVVFIECENYSRGMDSRFWLLENSFTANITVVPPTNESYVLRTDCCVLNNETKPFEFNFIFNMDFCPSHSFPIFSRRTPFSDDKKISTFRRS